MTKTKYLDEKTTITLRKSTVQRLQRYGNMGESFEEVVNRLMDNVSEGKA